MRAKLVVRIVLLLLTMVLLTGFGVLWHFNMLPTEKQLKVHLFEHNEFLKRMVLPEPSAPFPDVYAPAPKKRPRRCNQCTGGFMGKREWAQQLYPQLQFPNFYYGKNCLTEPTNFKYCDTTCLTLWIRQIGARGYESVAMDCADDFIFFSEDIKGLGSPYSNEAIVFLCNQTFTNERFGLQITYDFVRADHAEPAVLAKTLRETWVGRPGKKEKALEESTKKNPYFVYAILVGIFLIVFVLLFVCPLLFTKKKKKQNKKASNQIRPVFVSIQGNLRRSLRSRLRGLFRRKPSGYTAINQGDIFSQECSFEVTTDQEDILLDLTTGQAAYHCAPSLPPPPPPRNLNDRLRTSRTMSVPPPTSSPGVAYGDGPSRGSSPSIFGGGTKNKPIKMKLTKLANKTIAELPPPRLNFVSNTPSSSMFESRLSPLTITESGAEDAEVRVRI
ncbi:hypothetical protein CAEBREN_19193 [Caenorhabditis brenneri]|uniref:Uncharacterized protein n=1 Tax=Caenorhabditis brenneri TaxID=135651 RepID=G0MHY7_CAEBE|nr:hypothetical protein CAEBREN_19193 [Caenorhabditis brenneri]